MLAIRLRRTGSKKRPFFRVVVTDSRTARDSSFVEVLGHYNPRTKPETLKLDRERLDHWVKAGAHAVRHGAHADRPHAGAGSPAARRGGAARVVSRARDVVEVVARALADQPEAVRVTEREHRGQTVVELTMAPGDSGASSAARAARRRPCARWSARRRSSTAQGDGRFPRRRTERRLADDLMLVGRSPGRTEPRPGHRRSGDGFPDERFRVGADAAGRGPDARAARISSVRFHQGRPVVGARGRRDDGRRRAAGRGRVEGCRRERWRRCRTGRIYRHDLVGCAVQDTERPADRRGRRRSKGRGTQPAGRQRRRTGRC